MSEFQVNSFQVPNALVDKLMNEMSGNALKCLMYIIRQTRGWHKQFDSISASKFVETCGVSKNTALSALAELVKLGLVKKDKSACITGLNTYSLTSMFDAGEVNASANIELAASAEIEPVQNLTGANSELASANNAPVASANIAPTKDILFKDTIQKTLNIPFDVFWKLYDKCVDKKPCEAKWSKLKDSERQQVIAHLPKYIESTPDKTFRKNPQTYLNQKSWNNEIIASGTKSSGSAGQAQQAAPSEQVKPIKTHATQGLTTALVYMLKAAQKEISPDFTENFVQSNLIDGKDFDQSTRLLFLKAQANPQQFCKDHGLEEVA